MCRHVQARLPGYGLFTDNAALLPQTLGKVLVLITQHIGLKKLEAREGTEYRVDWHGDTPVIHELQHRSDCRPWQGRMHIQAVARHRRLMEQAAQEPNDGSLAPAVSTAGQA